jgi:hypothetical protein
VIPNRHVNRSTLRRTGSRAVFARFGADMFVPTCRHAVISGVFVVCLAVAAWAAAQAPRGIPDSLDDKEFWQLVRDLSEPDGFFEDENYVSNEMGYQRTMRRLQESVPPGGVFVGVGPEQNFAYVAALRPKMAFVLDIRRQNLIEHLMYKALFEVSGNRGEFLSRLFSRPVPPGLEANADVGELFRAYGPVPADRRLFDATLTTILDVLTERHRFELSNEDRAAVRKVLSAFYDSGPDLRYVFRGTTELHPTYAQMMTAADEAGRRWSVLGREDAFQHVRAMQQKNLIVPVVGDFAGPVALRAIGRYVRERGGAIDVFYTSNVESYLFRNGTWKAFYDSVLTLPLGGQGLFVRAFFGSTARECSATRPTIVTPVLGAMAPLIEAYRNGAVTSQCDLVVLSR